VVPGLGWYPDPAARHEQRFFDGRRWTAHVADAGVLAIDVDTNQPSVEAVPEHAVETEVALGAPGAFEDPEPVPAPSQVIVRHASARVDLLEWCFRAAMVALLVLFLAAIAFKS
jgi:hypothetical protein